MKDIVTCKNCNGKAEREYFTGTYGIEEEHILCNCGYCYEFAYGNYLEKYPGELTQAWTHENHVKIPVPELS